MGILAMLFRSILSYTIFLSSRKIVKSTIGFAENIRHSLQLHRCISCWRLYSGYIEKCEFCSSETLPLYSDYRTNNYDQENEEREGLEKQVYNDTRKFRFEPARASKLEVKYDRHTRRAN